MERFRKIVNNAAPIVLLVYLVIGLLAYVNVFPGSAAYFRSSSTTGVLARVFSTALICIYSALFFVLNAGKIKFPWRWFVAFVIVLFINAVAMFLIPKEYTVHYSASLYGFLRETNVTLGWKRLLTMYLSSISDFALGFCFLFLLPCAFKTRKQLLVVTIPMVLFMVAECLYSVTKEYTQYLAIFTDETAIFGGYNLSIGATFGDKQEFGAFLTVGFCCAVVSCFLLNGLPKPWRIGGRVFFSFCAFGFFVETFFTLCKTAILSNTFVVFCLLVAGFIVLYKRNKPWFWISVGAFSVLAVAVTLILTVDSFHADGVLLNFYKLVNSLFLNKVNGGIFSRFYIVKDYFNALSPTAFLFGLSKGGLEGYSAFANPESPGLHTGFIIFQAYYGLIGSILYAVLLIIVLNNLVAVFRFNKTIALALLGCFICSLVFNLSEGEVLIMSGSAAVFVFNVLCVVFAKGFVEHEKEKVVA